ncbi:MAG: SMP-30/gluconolactonase/LRE family protein [Planctomycetaceae bacterium]|jgi:sugar lactone lactonase YvrE|nr:SMP-30/gluconolactonase/LRE family protein [Planctomycetaceae bacterium]
MKTFVKLSLTLLFVYTIAANVVSNVAADEPVAKTIKAIELGDGMEHPDGMTIHPKTGDIILAVPLIGKKGNAWLLRITADDTVEKYFELPAHPETGRVTPLGIAFGPDGNLYVSDSQCLGGNPNHKSRILRVVHDKSGKPLRCETVVTGIVQANGLEISGWNIYVAETQVDPSIVEMPMTSGVFVFPINELSSRRPLRVQPYQKDPRFIFNFTTTDAARNGEQKVGANGIGLSNDGSKLYVANFGDKKLIEVTLGRGGRTVRSSRDCNTGSDSAVESIDGLKVCPKGMVFFADYVGNAVHVMNPQNGKSITLAKNALNPNAEQKKAGALDRCSEVCLRGSKLYVSNIDLETPESPHTITVLDLEGVDWEKLK